MLNLIKNEYAKIFHKKSSYIFLIILLISIIGMPLLIKYVNSRNYEDYYYGSYESEIEWAQDEEGNDAYVEKLKKAMDLGISEKDFFSSNSNWKVGALNIIYDNYWYSFNSDDITFTDAQKQKSEDLFTKGLLFVEKDDWKGFYNLQLEFVSTNPDLTETEKNYYKFVYEYMLENDIEPGTGKWQEEVLYSYRDQGINYEQLKALKDAGEPYDETAFASAERLTLISKYRLDNNISAAIYEAGEDELYSDTEIYIFTGALYNTMKNSTALLILVMIIVIIIAGGSISKEFSQGTIKFLLINPVKRSKIFWSKYLTVFSYSLLLTLVTFILEFLMCILVFGTSELNTELLVIESGKVIAHSALLFMVFRYLLAFVELLVAFTIAFMISSLFRNSALAITISLIIYFVGSTVCELAAMFNLDFFRYTIFANQNLTSIVNGKSSFVHMTTGFAVTVIIVHMILLLLTAHDAFTKKNV